MDTEVGRMENKQRESFGVPAARSSHLTHWAGSFAGLGGWVFAVPEQLGGGGCLCTPSRVLLAVLSTVFPYPLCGFSSSSSVASRAFGSEHLK